MNWDLGIQDYYQSKAGMLLSSQSLAVCHLFWPADKGIDYQFDKTPMITYRRELAQLQDSILF
jgi:hypothetical protein